METGAGLGAAYHCPKTKPGYLDNFNLFSVVIITLSSNNVVE